MGKRLNTDIFVKRSQEIHGDKYDYSLTNYVSAHKKVKIICKQHGVFEQKAWNHLHNDGCPICYGTKKYTKEEFIEKSNKTHLNKYDYSLVDYVNNSTKVKIICNQHGIFEQSPSSHVLQRHGCPSCNISKGEIFIQNFLSEKNILFYKQHTFSDCKNIRLLPFDFYLPDKNTCIEYDGEQHYKPIVRFNGEIGFQKTQMRDKIKNEYCKLNNIKLIRVTSKTLKILNDFI